MASIKGRTCKILVVSWFFPSFVALPLEMVAKGLHVTLETKISMTREKQMRELIGGIGKIM